MKKFRSAILFFLLFRGQASAQNNPFLPRLVKADGITSLYVQGKPFLILGGELGNSTTSSFDYIRPVWSKCKSIHLNTVLAPVYWEYRDRSYVFFRSRERISGHSPRR